MKKYVLGKENYKTKVVFIRNLRVIDLVNIKQFLIQKLPHSDGRVQRSSTDKFLSIGSTSFQF